MHTQQILTGSRSTPPDDRGTTMDACICHLLMEQAKQGLIKEERACNSKRACRVQTWADMKGMCMHDCA